MLPASAGPLYSLLQTRAGHAEHTNTFIMEVRPIRINASYTTRMHRIALILSRLLAYDPSHVQSPPPQALSELEYPEKLRKVCILDNLAYSTICGAMCVPTVAADSAARGRCGAGDHSRLWGD